MCIRDSFEPFDVSSLAVGVPGDATLWAVIGAALGLVVDDEPHERAADYSKDDKDQDRVNCDHRLLYGEKVACTGVA